MKSKKLLLTLSFLFINSITFCQQIGDGFAPLISDFTIPLKSGVYNGFNTIGAIPDNSNNGWQHLFVIRHPNIENNNQLQLASSLATNDRFFFRKIAIGSLGSLNPIWHELATRGVNTFLGNQSISGELKISSYSPLLVLQRDTNAGGFTQGIQTRNLDNTDNWFFGNLHANSWIVSKGDPNNAKFTILDNGNVGIGTTAPTAKFEITGGSTTSSLLNINNTLSQRINTANPAISLGIGYANSDNPFIQAYNSYNLTANNLILNPFSGNVGIGSIIPDQKLTVKGKIHAEEIIVDLSVPADYVFKKYYTGKSELKPDYSMPTLAEIESFTKKNHHLPNVPSAQEVQQNGLSLGEMTNVLLQKVEELTLYIIEQNKDIEELKAQVTALIAKSNN